MSALLTLTGMVAGIVIVASVIVARFTRDYRKMCASHGRTVTRRAAIAVFISK